MQEYHAKYIIVGAGLSGLTTAHELMKNGETDFIVIESRERIGGRIFTSDSIDFGATWFQAYHSHVIDLLSNLQLDHFDQYSQGRSILVYSTMAPEHYFETSAQEPAKRIIGGSSVLINALVDGFKDKIFTAHEVSTIVDLGPKIQVTANTSIFRAEKIVVTIPPLIGTRIEYQPTLPENVMSVMKNTHTWMSNAVKVGLTFKEPFWRNKGLSGTIIGQVGPVVELYDHSIANGNEHSLMGFLNEALRDLEASDRKERVLNYLSKYLGEEIHEHLSYKEFDWSNSRHTSCETIKSIYMSPDYGHDEFQKDYFEGKLLFSGTETSAIYGGYMEGAIYSGVSAAQWIMG